MTDKGITLIRKYEGCKLKAYKCPAGVWTIGYGTTRYLDGTQVKEGDTITQAQADEIFAKELENYERQVKVILGERLSTILPKLAIDALVSFAYNCGTGAFNKSTLLKVIRADKNNLRAIQTEFSKWNKSNGKVLQGLVKRRDSEFWLYAEGIASQYTKLELIKLML